MTTITEQFFRFRYAPPPTPEPTTSEIFLHPCPLCGGVADLKVENHGRGSMGAEPDRIFVACTDCGCSGGVYWEDSRKDPAQAAANAWNKRTE